MSKDWFHSCIVYQIMPDRFHIGNNLTIHQKIAQGHYPPHAIPKDWDELPEDRHAENNVHFYGGDLAGILEKLDYIRNLGADAMYLTPVFRSNSYHKYDTLDYTSIDPSLGDLATFEDLIHQAHQQNIKVIIDIVLNHVSDHHPYFKEAHQNPHSKYREYFYFTEPNTYQCWWGYPSMPELRLEHEAVKEEFITGKESVIRFWLEKGVDGIRLDCANDLGYEICRAIYETAKAINPDAIILGEVANFAAEWLQVLDGGQSYFITASIYSLLNRQISASQFGANLKTLYEQSPRGNLLNSLTMLSSHDSQRALTVLNGDMNTYRLALLLQFTLPGVPMIYYGEEIGMQGGADPLNRAPMQWNETQWNNDILSVYQQMIRLRKERVEFCYGEFLELSQWLANGVVAYFRYVADDPKQYSLVIINPTEQKKAFRLFIPYSYLVSDVIMEDLFTRKRIKSIDSFLDIEIDPLKGAVYIPDYLYKGNYSFYKRI
jgi:glycosidase